MDTTYLSDATSYLAGGYATTTISSSAGHYVLSGYYTPFPEGYSVNEKALGSYYTIPDPLQQQVDSFDLLAVFKQVKTAFEILININPSLQKHRENT